MKYKKVRRLNYGEAVRFHGHDGPFLALGYRLGRYLIRRLKPEGIMGLRITVRTRMQKPFTCLIDGLQCSTFATLGKGNLITRDSGRGNILVRAQQGDKVLTLRVSKRACDLCSNVKDLEKAARRVFRTPVNELWEQRD